MEDLAEIDAMSTPRGQNVQRQREIEFLSGSKEWVIGAVAVRTILRRSAPDQRAAQSILSDTFQSRDACWDVFQRDRPKANQSFRIIAHILCGPIIERSKC